MRSVRKSIVGTPCLISSCPTGIQRTPTGTIDDGHLLHLKTVHDIGETEGRRLLRNRENSPAS